MKYARAKSFVVMTRALLYEGGPIVKKQFMSDPQTMSLFSGFDERRFFVTSACAFAVPYLSILFVNFSQLSHC